RTRPVVLLSMGYRSLAPDFEKRVPPRSAAIPEGRALTPCVGALQRAGVADFLRHHAGRARCLRCRVASCWSLTNGRRFMVPSLGSPRRLQNRRHWAKRSPGSPSSAGFWGAAGAAAPAREACGGGFLHSAT